MPHTSSLKEQPAATSGKTSAGFARTIEEQVQLVRVFRLLAFEIPLQLVERKLEVCVAFRSSSTCARLAS